MQHTLPKSAGHRTCPTRLSFHLKCGEDHDGYCQIHGMPKGSLNFHLGLCNPVHIGHYVLNGQRFEFIGDVLPTAALVDPSEHDDLRYTFPTTYRDAKAFGR